MTGSVASDRSAARLLDVSGLTVEFGTARGTMRVVDGVSFAVDRGETVGLVGESGCGKSVSSLAVMGLIPSRNGSRPGRPHALRRP